MCAQISHETYVFDPCRSIAVTSEGRAAGRRRRAVTTASSRTSRRNGATRTSAPRPAPDPPRSAR